MQNENYVMMEAQVQVDMRVGCDMNAAEQYILRRAALARRKFTPAIGKLMQQNDDEFDKKYPLKEKHKIERDELLNGG